MSPPDAPQPFEGKPRRFAQERARKTYEALMEAGEGLFAARGFDGTQAPDIAARAGVSVGSFYRYFADKRALFLELLRRELMTAHGDVMAELTPDKFAGADPRAAIEAALEALLGNLTRRERMTSLFLEMSMRDAEVAELRRSFDELARRRIVELIRAIARVVLVADPEATAYVIHTAVIECAVALLGVRGPCPIERARGVRALSELLHRALFGPR